ncbi:MAG TPA: hypothetical protein VFB32_02215 [Rudaea sp.]|nr:hypothetical protein [Rudaea sp.]
MHVPGLPPPHSEAEPRALDGFRLALAFGLAPLLPAFYSAIFFAEPWILPIGLAAACASEAFVGVPMFVWLRRRGWLGAWQFTAAGAVCALPALTEFWWLGSVPHLAPFAWPDALLLPTLGAFAGACFWLLGIAGKAPLRFKDVFGPSPPEADD